MAGAIRVQLHLFPGTQARVAAAPTAGTHELLLLHYVTDQPKAQKKLNSAALRVQLDAACDRMRYSRVIIRIVCVGEWETRLTFNNHRPDRIEFDDGHVRSGTIRTDLATFTRPSRKGMFYFDPIHLMPPYNEYNQEILVYLRADAIGHLEDFEWQALESVSAGHRRRAVTLILPVGIPATTYQVNRQERGFTYRGYLETRNSQQRKLPVGLIDSLETSPQRLDRLPPVHARRYANYSNEMANMRLSDMLIVEPGQQVTDVDVPQRNSVFLHLLYIYNPNVWPPMDIQPLDAVRDLLQVTNGRLKRLVIHLVVRMVFHPFADFIPGICPEVQLLYYPEPLEAVAADPLQEEGMVHEDD